jgi:hypothetical protein
VGNSTKGYERASITYTTAPTSGYNLFSYFSNWSSTPGGPVSSECTSANYSLSQALNHGFWTIDASVSPASGTYTITLYNRTYTNSTGTQWSVMKRTPSSTGTWGLNGFCNMASTAATTIRTGLTGFSDFGIVQSGSPLPVELLYFTAVADANAVMTSWATASEINSDYFMVEKSKDGISFSDIGMVDGSGNSSSQKNYSFPDTNPFTGINYYRLRQVDFDGTVYYSEVAAVNISAIENPLIIFPNPSQDLIQCEFNSVNDGIAQIVIHDVTGKTVLTEKILLTKGFNSVPLKISNLSYGVYHLRVYTADKNSSTLKARFVKMIRE